MRKLTDSDLERLESFLLEAGHDETMLLSELDGFLAGVVISPDLVPPSQWWPVIWGEGGPVFETEGEINEILGLIMARYNQIARALSDRGAYAPILEEDSDGTWLWELWASGFGKAFALAPGGWCLYEQCRDEDVSSAFHVLVALALMQSGEERPSETLSRELEAHADAFIADCVQCLNAHRLATHGAPGRSQPVPSVGRNDPCPCGSGKKFKKCCLN